MRNPFSSRTRSLPRAAASQPRPTHETGMPCKPRTALRWRGRGHPLAGTKETWVAPNADRGFYRFFKYLMVA